MPRPLPSAHPLPPSPEATGFTMIEIIAVLVLLGVTAAMVSSRIVSTGADVVGASEELKGHLRFAQMKAMNDSVPWGIDLNGNQYTLIRNGTASAVNLPNGNAPTKTLAPGVTATATADPVTFDEWGSPGSSTVTVTVSDTQTTRTITVTRKTGFIP